MFAHCFTCGKDSVAATRISRELADRGVAALRDTIGAPSVLIGHSLAAATRIPETTHVQHPLGPATAEIEARDIAEVQLAGRPFRIPHEFLHDIKHQDQTAGPAGLDRALLVMHSSQDDLVGIDNARIIFEAARHPKSFLSLDGADHPCRRHPRRRGAHRLVQPPSDAPDALKCENPQRKSPRVSPTDRGDRI
ncbi:hypothetical protein [Lentzea sp. NPDC004782]|uniref:alpha/beta hydrolase family protein n=1 Tax=Lentzea sp. NPDC004782 TaxID=3154458 RepID=UPI0033A0D63B